MDHPLWMCFFIFSFSAASSWLVYSLQCGRCKRWVLSCEAKRKKVWVWNPFGIVWCCFVGLFRIQNESLRPVRGVSWCYRLYRSVSVLMLLMVTIDCLIPSLKPLSVVLTLGLPLRSCLLPRGFLSRNIPSELSLILIESFLPDRCSAICRQKEMRYHQQRLEIMP